MLDLVSDGSSWDEIVTLAQKIEDSGASIINTGQTFSVLSLLPLDLNSAQESDGMKHVFQLSPRWYHEVLSLG
jgi:hypothetical protein